VCTALLLSGDRSIVQVADTKDLTDGSYVISFLPTQVGRYLLQVSLNGELLAGRVDLWAQSRSIRCCCDGTLLDKHSVCCPTLYST
jgi:hypothetical protein